MNSKDATAKRQTGAVLLWLEGRGLDNGQHAEKVAPPPPCLEPDLPPAPLASQRGPPSPTPGAQSYVLPAPTLSPLGGPPSCPVLRDANTRVRPVQRHRGRTSRFTEGSHPRSSRLSPCLSSSVQALRDPGCTWSQPHPCCGSLPSPTSVTVKLHGTLG